MLAIYSFPKRSLPKNESWENVSGTEHTMLHSCCLLFGKPWKICRWWSILMFRVTLHGSGQTNSFLKECYLSPGKIVIVNFHPKTCCMGK